MADILIVGGVVLLWILLQRVIFPRLGIPT